MPSSIISVTFRTKTSHLYIYMHTHKWSELLVPSLVNMIKEAYENKCALLIFLNIIFFYHKNLTFHWIIIILIGGKYHYEINVFLKYMLDTITGTP